MRVTISFGPANSITKNVDPYTRLSAVLTREVKAALGCGDNVQALIGRRHVDGNYQIGSDLTVELETVSNSKAANIEVTVSFGPANKITKSVRAGTTVGDILANRDILAALGAGKNVKALIDRAEQSADSPIEDGDEIVLETVSNSKA